MTQMARGSVGNQSCAWTSEVSYFSNNVKDLPYSGYWCGYKENIPPKINLYINITNTSERKIKTN
jgi:hypothetical protein